MGEVWKKFRDYPYKVSNYGRVKRIKSGQGTYIGKILKQSLDSTNYPIVCFSKNGKQKTFRVHKLVIEAFIGPCPKNKEVNHVDGNKQHNYYKNLKYVTHRENIKHSYEVGLRSAEGESNGRSKLKERDVKKIRRLYKTGKYTQEEIAKKFGVVRGSISGIVYRKNWKCVK